MAGPPRRGAVFVISAWLLFASSAPFSLPTVEAQCGRPPPDIALYTSGDDVERFMADCGAAGRHAYRNLQLADLVYPAVSGIAMTTALAFTITRLTSSRRLLLLATLPMAGALFDYLENAAAWATLARFPDNGIETHLLGIASVAKQTTFWTAGALLVVCVALLLVRTLQRLGESRRTPVAL